MFWLRQITVPDGYVPAASELGQMIHAIADRRHKTSVTRGNLEWTSGINASLLTLFGVFKDFISCCRKHLWLWCGESGRGVMTAFALLPKLRSFFLSLAALAGLSRPILE